MELNEIATQIDALEARAKELGEKALASQDDDQIAEVKNLIGSEIQPKLAELTRDRDDALREVERKSLTSKVSTLEEALNELRSGFPVSTGAEAGDQKALGDDFAYNDGEHSFYADIRMANKGRQDAIERIAKSHRYLDAKGQKALGAMVKEDGKALVEGTGSQGGYLVQTQIERQIIDVRELDNVLRPLCSSINVTTTSIELDQITLGTTAGWVAELATKPESTSMTLATVTASVFTAAGLATISNQLLADSNPAVDQLVTRDLAKRLVALEETAFMAGSGTGQPLGVLNTPGIQTVNQTVAGASATGGILDSVLTAIGNVQSLYGSPSAMVMHPRTWTAILKDKNTNGIYTYGSPSDSTNNSPLFQQGRTIYNGPSRTLWGVPVILSNRVPTNLGGGTNESRIIIADFSEALILDRQGITVDESPHVFFTSNQTVFRAEERVGFTAARQPNAFCVVGGSGLANS